MNNNRVVVTGMGMVSPLGLDTASTWQALLAGKSGVDYITLFNAESYDTRFAAEVKGFDPTAYMERKEARRMDRFAQLAVAASREAAAQSGVKPDLAAPGDLGVIIGSGIGGLATISEQIQVLQEKGPGRVSPFTAPMMIGDMAAAQVSIALGARGPCYCLTTSCSSGADAIGTAFHLLRRGDARAIIAGGAEAVITPIGVASFNAARALSTRNDEPQRASRPFDVQRDGFVMGEGAAVLVLERLDSALARNAMILGEVIAYGATADAYHITQLPEGGEGGARAMALALKTAGLRPADIDYINAHGTSTPLNDKAETQAIKSVFGEHAYSVPISSTKSMTGHLIGAAGAIEAAICLLAINHGVIPPTINLDYPDPECDLDYVPRQARPARLRTALSNSFGFGGHNSVLIVREFGEEMA